MWKLSWTNAGDILKPNDGDTLKPTETTRHGLIYHGSAGDHETICAQQSAGQRQLWRK